MENFTISEDLYYDYDYFGYNETDIIASDADTAYFVVMCVIVTIGLPLTLVAIYAVYSLVRRDHFTPIYVINLLISDVIQLCSMTALLSGCCPIIARIFYACGLVVSVGFMVCVALERYLSIACPLWYRFKRTIKIPVTVCVLVWILLPAVMSTFSFFLNHDDFSIILGIFFSMPLLLFIFFLFGTLRALSASRVPLDEKRRVIGILVVVLLIYTLLFLPSIICQLAVRKIKNYTFMEASFMFIQFSPLADLFLYVFMRRGIADQLLASVCCCNLGSSVVSRMDSSDTTYSTA